MVMMMTVIMMMMIVMMMVMRMMTIMMVLVAVMKSIRGAYSRHCTDHHHHHTTTTTVTTTTTTAATTAAVAVYSPVFGTPQSAVNMVSFVAAGMLRGDHQAVQPHDLKAMLADGGTYTRSPSMHTVE